MKKKSKEQIRKENQEIIFIFVFLLGCILTTLFVLTFNFENTDKAIRCKNIKGDWCNNYQIEKGHYDE